MSFELNIEPIFVFSWRENFRTKPPTSEVFHVSSPFLHTEIRLSLTQVVDSDSYMTSLYVHGPYRFFVRSLPLSPTEILSFRFSPKFWFPLDSLCTHCFLSSSSPHPSGSSSLFIRDVGRNHRLIGPRRSLPTPVSFWEPVLYGQCFGQIIKDNSFKTG